MGGIGKQLLQWLMGIIDSGKTIAGSNDVKMVAGYVAGLITLIAALLRLRRVRKHLSYSWKWLAPSQLGVAARDAYRTLRGQEPKERVRALKVRLWNAGQQAIERGDFDGGSPIELYFDSNRLDGAVVAFAQAATSAPESLKPEVASAGDHSVLIQPLLLNSGDEIRVEALLRGPLPRGDGLRRLLSMMSALAPRYAIRIRARIAGVSDPRRVRFPVGRILLPQELRPSAARLLRLAARLAVIPSVFILAIPVIAVFLSTLVVRPAGIWISPAAGQPVVGVVHFAARAFPTKASDPRISYVNFTVFFPEARGFQIACRASPPPSGDVYACDRDLAHLGAPAGELTISFDVYDVAGNVNEAPNGERTIEYVPSS